jgi:hypothetical protein
MKNYTFRIKTSEEAERDILKKQFTLKLKNNIDLYNMFEDAIEYIDHNWYKFFKFRDINFKIIRGNNEMCCYAQAGDCPRCGTWMDFYWKNNF